MKATILFVFILIIIATECHAVEPSEKQSGICELCDEKLTRQQKESKLQQKEIDLLEKEVNSLKLKLDAVEKSVLGFEKSSEGVSYIRWGRNTCPGSANIVYKGEWNSSKKSIWKNEEWEWLEFENVECIANFHQIVVTQFVWELFVIS